jgi:HlyD family secretion protein
MRKLVIVLLVLVVAAGAVYLGSQRLLMQPVAEPTPATLQSGPERSEQVRCSGRLVPARWLALSFDRAGRVARVAVQEGAEVQEGEVLAELEAQDSSLELRAAEQRLVAAQAQLAQAQATPVPGTLEAARAQLAAATASLETLQSSPTEAELQQAKLRVDQARNALWAAQASRDAQGGRCTSCADYDEAQARVASAEVAVRLAEIDYEQVKAGPAAATIASAEADLARAKESLAALTTGPTEQELAILQANVAQAEVALEQVKAAQEEAGKAGTLRAPFAGTVTTINVREGETAGAGSEAMVVADLSELEVVTTNLTELDIGAVRPEQPVEVVIHGFGTPILHGRVTFISAQGDISPSGEVLYKVVIALDRQDPSLRWGMTASLTFGKRIK